MALLEIVRLGHPALRSQTSPVELSALSDPALQQVIDDMVETMHAAHGVGLAAPQVGLGLQLFVYQAESSGIPLRVVVNPLVTPLAGEPLFDWEGCLSIPDLRGLVPRHPAVKLAARDRHGEPFELVAEDFEARIIQHELDHLHGVIFLDRMRALQSLAYAQELEELYGEHAVDEVAEQRAAAAPEPAPGDDVA